MASRSMMWTYEEAFDFCAMIEPFAAKNGAHVALTGGCLYKEGQRKDVDIVLYSHDTRRPFKPRAVVDALENAFIDFIFQCDYGHVIKCVWRHKRIDFILPEENGDYDEDDANEEDTRPPWNKVKHLQPPSAAAVHQAQVAEEFLPDPQFVADEDAPLPF